MCVVGFLLFGPASGGFLWFGFVRWFCDAVT